MRVLLFTAFCLLATAPAPAAVNVTHADPARFSDARDRHVDAEEAMREIKRHLERLGERFLPPGREVRIEVLDVDRAGRAHLTRSEVRIMKGLVDFPCIELAWSAGGSPPTRERVCDERYMLKRLPAAYSGGDALAYEKRMLDDWFRKRFAGLTADAPR